MGFLSGIVGGQSTNAGFTWSGTGILPGGQAQLSDFLAGGEKLVAAAADLLGSGELAAHASALEGSAFAQLFYDTDAPVPPGQGDATAWTLGLTAGAIWEDAAAQFSGNLELLFQQDGGVDVSFSGHPEPYAPPAAIPDHGGLIA